MFKTCLNFSGNVFGHFEKKWKFFHFSDVFPCFDPPGCTGQYFFPEKYLKTSSTLVWKLLRKFLDTFRNSIFFDFFFEFLQVLISRLHWSRKVRKKSAQNKFGHFWKCFSGFWKNEIFSFFLNFFRLLDPPGCTGRNFSPEKIPRGMLKTCSNTFGNVFGHFEKMKVFQFFEVFPSLDLPGCTGQFFLRKLPRNKFETCLDTSKNVLDTFEKSNFFRFFYEFLQNSISRLHWARKVRKKLPQASLDTFGKVFRDFGTLKSFRVLWIFLSLLCALGTAFSVEKLNQNILKQCFWEHFRTILKFSKFFLFLKFFPSLDPPRCTGDFFSKQNYLKTGSEYVWTILGTVLDTLEILNFSIFPNLFLTRPSRVHCAKHLPKKLPRNMFKTCLIAFGNVFWAFWKIEGFSSFLEFFQVSTLQGALGNFFRKNHLKTSSRLVWTLLGKFLDTFEFSNFFRFFFSNFSKFRPSRVHWSIYFYRKNYVKACSNVFELFGDRFWAFGKKMEVFPFFWRFSMFRPSRVHWAIFFPEKYLKTSSTLVWKLLRTFLDTFRNSIFFDFFPNFYKFWSPGCTGQEKFGKNHLKTILDTFGNVFRDFENLNFFPFFEIFRFLDPPGCTGRSFLPEKIPRSMLKTCLNTFGNVFGHFEKMKVFQFFEVFPSLDLPGCTGQIFPRKLPQNKFKICLDTFRTVFGHFWNFKFLSIFISNFSKFRPSRVHWSIF